MGYMNDLRQLVGDRPLIMVGATLLALNHDHQLLMIKRTDINFPAFLPSLWERYQVIRD